MLPNITTPIHFPSFKAQIALTLAEFIASQWQKILLILNNKIGSCFGENSLTQFIRKIKIHPYNFRFIYNLKKS